MRKDTASKIATLVALTRSELLTHGRPRKPPGRPRPASHNGKRSLERIIHDTAKQLKYGKGIVAQAETLIVNELWPWYASWKTANLPSWANLKGIDTHWSDNRELGRSLRRLQDKLEKQLA